MGSPPAFYTVYSFCLFFIPYFVFERKGDGTVEFYIKIFATIFILGERVIFELYSHPKILNYT